LVWLRQVIKPDQRFLGAVPELVTVINGKPPSAVTASWKSDHWVVSVDGTDIGSLSPMPSFAEGVAFLRNAALPMARAARIGPWESAGNNGNFASFDLFSLEPTQVLHDADKRWRAGERTPAVLDDAGRALVALAIQSIDRVGVTDPLQARALALLAARQELLHQPCPDDAAVLADLMGYFSESVELAKTAGPASAAGLFMARDLAPLRQAAEKSGAPRSLKFLFLLRFGAASMSDWAAWVQKYCGPSAAGLPLYRAAMNVAEFGPDRDNAEALLYAVTEQVSAPSAAEKIWAEFYANLLSRPEVSGMARMLGALGGTQQPSPKAILERFEQALASAVPSQGMLSGGEPERSWYRSFFYSALYGIGSYELDLRGSAPDAVAFGEFLDNAKSGAAPDFRRWFVDIARLRDDSRTLDAVIADVGGLPWLGHPAIQRALNATLRPLPAPDPRRKKVANAYVSRIDTRSGGRRGMESICWFEWYDLKCYEAYRTGYGQLAFEKGMGEDPGYYQYLDDWATVRRILDDPGLPTAPRLNALFLFINTDRIEPAAAVKEFEKLYKIDPNGVALNYVYYLRDHRLFKEAESVARREVARNQKSTDALLHAQDAGILAVVLEEQGRAAEAWRVIEPWISTWKSDALGSGAIVLEGNGRHEEALDLAKKNVDRYPDTIYSRIILTKVLWRQGKYGEVPAVFSDPRHTLPVPAFRDDLAPQFAKFFSKKPTEDARKAFEPFLKANFNPWILKAIACAPAKTGRDDTAFALLSDLTKSKPGIGTTPLDPKLDLYRFMVKSRGEKAALEWIRSVINENDRDQVLEAAFNQRFFNLFWQTTPDAAHTSAQTWLLEAASVVLDPETGRSHRDSVAGHFREATGPTGEYGRYLLNGGDETPVVTAGATRLDRGDAAYVLGLRALAEGRYADASDWFHVCVLSERPSAFSREGATTVLKRWLEDAHPMKTMAERKFF
jgi:tetratricopeptide (TPR) repeat protein